MLTWVYTYYYTDPSKADIYRYFNDSKIISHLLFSHPIDWLKIMMGVGTYDVSTFGHLQNTQYFSHPVADAITNNTLLIRFISLLNYFSFYNIYINTLLLNFITFISLVLLFKVLVPYFAAFPQMLCWPLFLIPSVVFWSSGLLKESVFFIGISLFIFASLHCKRLLKSFVIVLLSIAIIGFTKIYVAGILLFCSGFLLGGSKLNLSTKAVFALTVTLYAVVIVLVWQFAGGYIFHTLMDKRNEFISLAAMEHSGSILETKLVTDDCVSIAALLPSAFYNSVLRPCLWDSGPVLQRLFALENSLFIVSQIILLVFFFRLPKGNAIWLALFCFLFGMLNYAAIGLTVPVLGAIVHYRIIAMPFLAISVLLMTDMAKLRLSLAWLGSFLKIKN